MDNLAKGERIVLANTMRKGGLRLIWKDFTPIYSDGNALSESENGRPVCVAVRVYRGSTEEYTTFITPTPTPESISRTGARRWPGRSSSGGRSMWCPAQLSGEAPCKREPTKMLHCLQKKQW